MTLGYGFDSWVGIGAEGTYGSAVARTKFLEYNKESLAMADFVIQGESVYNIEKSSDNFTSGKKKVGGGLGFDM